MADIRPARIVKCFCCGEDLSAAMKGEDPWHAPGDGLRFSADGTFGSGFFDVIAEGEGVSLQLVICDQCLQNNESRTRRVRYNRIITEEVIDAVADAVEEEIADKLKEELDDKKEDDDV